MKISTKFFIVATVLNVVLSCITAWNSMRELRLVDIVTFYGTAFGAGASVAAAIVSLQRKKLERQMEKNKLTEQ